MNRPGIKPNPRWEALTQQTPIGQRLLMKELALALGITHKSARHYTENTGGRRPLPQGWRVLRIGKTLLIERIQEDDMRYTLKSEIIHPVNALFAITKTDDPHWPYSFDIDGTEIERYRTKEAAQVRWDRELRELQAAGAAE